MCTQTLCIYVCDYNRISPRSTAEAWRAIYNTIFSLIFMHDQGRKF